MAEDVNDLTIEYVEDGETVVKELDKAVLTKGAWATLMFKYQDWDRRKEELGPVKFTIRRYRKMRGEYRQQAKFNISSLDQAEKIVEVLQGWIAEAGKE
ncbi:MAG: hypothetical protein P1P84_10085 [Deferrisomatales bacterium]|nr:hypothetical protein [Deferrisomatales bacterium]HSH70361.1 hypothetical protein [Deferrisomatales bacterium]